jgi:hypothetical protein
MDAVNNKVRQQVELRGCDNNELEGRIELLREVIRDRGGTIVAIKWNGGRWSRRVSVFYDAPSDAGAIEIPRTWTVMARPPATTPPNRPARR